MNTVIAYSGGLDTSAAIVWLKKIKKVEKLFAVLINVGQNEDFDLLIQCATKLGADSVQVIDARQALCEQGISYLLKSLARYENQYLLGTAIARPFIAEAVMKVASELNADSVCHGATGKGNDYLRFEQTILSINPSMKIISPWREWQLGGRQEALNLLKETQIHFQPSLFTYSQDANLWHTSYEGGSLEDIASAVPEELKNRMLQNGSAQIHLKWANGIPTKLNKKALPLHKLIEELNRLLFHTGYGWADLIETRTNGIKSRGIYYTAAGSLLYQAQLSLAALYFSGPTLRWIQENGFLYSQLIYEGHWNHPLLKALNQSLNSLYQNTHGEIEIQVQGNQLLILNRLASPNKFNSHLVGFETMKTWSNAMSESLVQIQQLKWNSEPFERKS